MQWPGKAWRGFHGRQANGAERPSRDRLGQARSGWFWFGEDFTAGIGETGSVLAWRGRDFMERPGRARLGRARLGLVGRGWERILWKGQDWRATARNESARQGFQGLVWRGMVRSGANWWGQARHGEDIKARRVVVVQGQAGRGVDFLALLGAVCRGMAWRGRVGHGHQGGAGRVRARKCEER